MSIDFMRNVAMLSRRYMHFENHLSHPSEPRKIGASLPLTSLSTDAGTIQQILRYRDYSDAAHIELWLEDDILQRDYARIKRALGGMACTIHAPFVDVSLVTSNSEYAHASLNRIREATYVADQLEATVVTVHPGKWSVIGSHDDACYRLVERLSAIQAKGDVTLAVENLKPKRSGVQRNLVCEYADFQKLLALDSSISFTLDIGHAMQSGIDIDRTVRMLGGNLKNIHLHQVARNGVSHVGTDTQHEADLLLDSVASSRSEIPITLEVLDPESQFQTLRRVVRATKDYLHTA